MSAVKPGEMKLSDVTPQPDYPFPWVTTAIVAAWIVVYALAWLTGTDRTTLTISPQTALRWGGNLAAYTMDGQWWRLVTNKFLHQSPDTLAVVAWMFWSAGRVVERSYGRLGLLAVYFGAAITSSIATLAFTAPNLVVTGSVSATLGAFGAIVGYVLAVRGGALAETLRPIRFSGPVMALWLAWRYYQKSLDVASVSVGLLTGFLLGITLAPTGTAPSAARMRAARWPMALAATAVIAGVVWTQVKDPPYLISEARVLQRKLQEFQSTNNALVDRKDDWERRARGGAQTATSLGEELEREHLPAWRGFRDEMRAAPDRPGIPDVEYVPVMKRYTEAQVHYLEALREWTRSGGDDSKTEEIRKQRGEVEAALAEIRVLSNKKTAEAEARKSAAQAAKGEKKQ